MSKHALIGKAGEALVAAHLMRRGIYVAHPAYDGGIDLLAFREETPSLTVPIQVKARAGLGYRFERAWFKIPGAILVHVWNLGDPDSFPSCYIFASLDDVGDALGRHAKTPSWLGKGIYHVTDPKPHHLERMSKHLERWDRIAERLGTSN